MYLTQISEIPQKILNEYAHFGLVEQPLERSILLKISFQLCACPKSVRSQSPFVLYLQFSSILNKILGKIVIIVNF